MIHLHAIMISMMNASQHKHTQELQQLETCAYNQNVPQGQLKPPPNNVQVSVAADDTPPHNYDQHGECFPA